MQLAKIIPWEEFEEEYAFMFPSNRGNVAKPVRMALGALIIQARCGYSDRELVQQIAENPYLQYFIGLKEYRLTRPFTPVALVKFRKRFNERIALAQQQATNRDNEAKDKDHNDPQGGSGSSAAENSMNNPISTECQNNQGTLILDVTCSPDRYTTDLDEEGRGYYVR